MQKKGFLKFYIVLFSFLSIFSCNKDFYSVGLEIFEEQFDDLQTKTFPIFSYQQSLDKVQTNNISSVQLGTFSDDFLAEQILVLYLSLMYFPCKLLVTLIKIKKMKVVSQI